MFLAIKKHLEFYIEEMDYEIDKEGDYDLFIGRLKMRGKKR